MTLRAAAVHVHIGIVRLQCGDPLRREIFAERLREALEGRLSRTSSNRADEVMSEIAGRVADHVEQLSIAKTPPAVNRRLPGGKEER